MIGDCAETVGPLWSPSQPRTMSDACAFECAAVAATTAAAARSATAVRMSPTRLSTANDLPRMEFAGLARRNKIKQSFDLQLSVGRTAHRLRLRRRFARSVS